MNYASNRERGKALFIKKILAANEDLDKEAQARLKEFGAEFESQVGVMEVLEPVEGGDGITVYSAVKMASACVKAALDGAYNLAPYYELNADARKPTEEADAPKKIVRAEGGLTQDKMGRIDAVTLTPASQALEEELNSNTLKYRIITNEDGSTRLCGEDAVINIATNIRKSELSAEGKRFLGILPANYDSSLPLSAEETNDILDDTLYGDVTYDDAGNIQSVECPYCKKSDFFQIEWDKFGCFSCDKEFEVDMGLDDKDGAEETQEGG